MQMFNNKLVVAIKNNGKVLKEVKDSTGNINTYLPFSAEYVILIKNLNTVRAIVYISIDGKSVDDNLGFVIMPNESVEIERFIKNGNLKEGNKFKFIERTSTVEAHRGVQAEDGLIRVEFVFEKVTPIEEVYKTYSNYIPPVVWPMFPSPSYKRGYWEWKQQYTPYTNMPVTNMPAFNSMTSSSNVDNASVVQKGSILRSNSLNASASVGVNEVGITVEGAVSNQQFVSVASFPVESTRNVIVLKLVGVVGEKQVKEPVVARQKQTCKTCGKRNRSQGSFCSGCGTSLQIIG